MSASVIARKEALVASRDRRLRGIYIALLLAVIAALSVGVVRTNTFEMERTAAAQADRANFDAQGSINPHSAAHYSKYAFMPIPSLSGFDPGVIDYAGMAVWMEGHVQNPATFRRAEGAGDLARFVILSPAWVLQYLIPLLVVLLLFASYAGERQDGTLRQVMSYGASPSVLFNGKLRGAMSALLKLLILLGGFVAVAILAFGEGAPQEDLGIRLAGLFFTYAVYLFIYAMLTIGLSALCSSRRAAAIALISVWSVVTVLAPRLGGDIAVMRTPQPDAFDTTFALKAVSGDFGNSEYADKHREEFLATYGVTDVNDAPVDFAAHRLQASEDHANPLWDDFYGGLRDGYASQENTLKVLSVLSPTSAIMALSSGLSGTDRFHHTQFVQEAEAHRRVIIRQMNEDMIYNANGQAWLYQSDASFWPQIPAYEGRLPSIGTFVSSYLVHAGILLFWAVASFLFARWAANRAARLEAVK